MLYKALKSFAGKVSMTIGDTKEINDQAIISDLTRAGFIVAVKGEAKAEPETETKEPAKRGRKKKGEG